MPAAQPQPARYAAIAIALHWTIAAALLFQLLLGFRLDDIAALPLKFAAFQLHKSVGITILLLSLVRLALRWRLPRPAEVGSGLALLAARATHFGFYAVMIGGPLTGWALVSTAKVKVPTRLFGVVPWPHLPLPIAANDPAFLGHVALAWLLPVLLALHIGGALWHMRLRDAVPGRMVPSGLPVHGGIAAGLVLLGGAAWAGASGPVPEFWSTPASRPAPAGTASAAPTALPATPTAAAASPASAEPAADDSASAAPAESTAAASAEWTRTGGTLGFATSYGGSPISGRFAKWDATIHFAEDDLAHAQITATIDLASAATDDASRDDTLRGPSFLDAAAHPTARFVATGFTRTGPGHYAAPGRLTLHGVSHPVRLAFDLKLKGDSATASGSATLSRLAFGVGSDEWKATDQVPDAVAVHFTIAARRD